MIKQQSPEFLAQLPVRPNLEAPAEGRYFVGRVAVEPFSLEDMESHLPGLLRNRLTLEHGETDWTLPYITAATFGDRRTNLSPEDVSETLGRFVSLRTPMEVRITGLDFVQTNHAVVKRTKSRKVVNTYGIIRAQLDDRSEEALLKEYMAFRDRLGILTKTDTDRMSWIDLAKVSGERTIIVDPETGTQIHDAAENTVKSRYVLGGAGFHAIRMVNVSGNPR